MTSAITEKLTALGESAPVQEAGQKTNEFFEGVAQWGSEKFNSLTAPKPANEEEDEEKKEGEEEGFFANLKRRTSSLLQREQQETDQESPQSEDPQSPVGERFNKFIESTGQFFSQAADEVTRKSSLIIEQFTKKGEEGEDKPNDEEKTEKEEKSNEEEEKSDNEEKSQESEGDAQQL